MSELELRIPPALQVIIIAAAMWAIAYLFPAFSVSVVGLETLAATFLAIGGLVAAAGVFEFRKSSTTVDPRFPEQSSSLVVTGVYRFSRNPMYLGFLLALVGCALYVRNYLAFAMLPVFVAYMTRFQIRPEERYMARKFGKAFDAYAANVRRWI